MAYKKPQIIGKGEAIHAYKKPQIIAKSEATQTYVAGCPPWEWACGSLGTACRSDRSS